MMRRSLLASVALAALTAVLGAYADEPAKGAKGQPPASAGDKTQPALDQATIAAKQKELGEKFSAFEKQLLTLQQRLANSSNQKDKDRAAQLKKVLEAVGDREPSKKFSILVKALTDTKIEGTFEAADLVKQSAALAKDLKDILELLKSAEGGVNRKEERLALEALKKELEKVIRDEKNIRNKINNGDNDPKQIAGDQSDTTSDTKKLDGKLGKDGKGEGGEATDQKGKAKDGGKGEKADGKATNKDGEGGKSGDSKDGGKGDSKKGNSKDGGKEGGQGGKDGKDGKGEAKDGKGADGAKAGAGKDGQGGGKEAGKDKGGDGSKAGDGKQAGKDGGKEGDKGGAKGGDKAGDKPGDQAGAKKAGDGAEAGKAGDKKAGEGSKSESSASKGGEGSKSDSKGGEAKSGDGKSSGASKSSGQQSGDDQAGGGKGDNSPPPPGNNNPKDDIGVTKKKIQEAIENMKKAEDEIAKNNRPDADDQASKAIKNLEDAKKKLEDLIRQLREEELERVLAALINRCQKMLQMQIDVLGGTLKVQGQIEGRKGVPDRTDKQDSIALSDEEEKIVQEATKAIEMLEAEGSAVAFPEVFQQIREDMKHVKRRLGNTDVGDVTVTIEQDIIETLRDMIKALEKAKKDLDDKKNPPQPPKDQPPQPPQDQKLLDKIAELKMLKAMQVRVNSRTDLYSKMYQGERANTPEIQSELRDVAGRQERIFEVANKLARGDNQ